jgi:5-methylcytosine-specific restriction endonuclease McrA
MPWGSTPESRRRDAATYGSAGYRRNRDLARRRAAGYCEQCQHRHGRLQCDHVIPVSQGGGHAVANLRMLCAGPGSCQCHEKKTAGEGGGYRARRTGAADPDCTPRTQW